MADGSPGLGFSLGPLDFSFHGYLRAPLRLSWRDRGNGVKEGEASKSVHTPWLVDDDYFRSGFAYMRTQESDWSELFLSAGNKYVTGTVALMGSLYSDWARPLLDRQWGIAQGFVTFNWRSEGPRLKFRVQVKGGAFWDRFGWLESYDTYLFGRTHQMGGQVRLDFEGGRFSYTLIQGIGAHLEAIDANQGLTLLNYLVAGFDYRRMLQSNFYFLDAKSQDKRQLKELADADMRVIGVDVGLRFPWIGRLYLAFSAITASQSTYLSPAIEILHSLGGRGLSENFFGTDKSDNGTGTLWNFALESHLSLRAVVERRLPRMLPLLHGGDLTVRLFGLLTYAQSKQVDPNPAINRDDRTYLKWGFEPAVRLTSWLIVSLRYDRVVLDMKDDANSFRILTPRLTLTTHYWVDAQIFLQYSHYYYGDRVALRPGQVALETVPDRDVFKIQAQIVF